ncbi:MAG TPA: NADH-quinone oxidoreductase subunit C [Bacteroidota bacterium]
MDAKEKYQQLLKDAWGDRLTLEPSVAPNELYVALDAQFVGSLSGICSALVKSFKAMFVTLIPVDERPTKGSISVYYVFSIVHDDLFLFLKVPVDPRHMELPSIAARIEAANWFEREMKDWFGIMAFPNISRLASHPDWPEDVHPMLKEFNVGQTVPRVRGDFEFKHVEGEGIFEIPVGPVHAGIIEPGHFRFSVAGEPIINLDVQLYYTHKATEKVAEGMAPERAVFLAERVSGDTSFGHALAFCHAVERLSAIELSLQAQVSRTILLELERLYNHIGDIGAVMLDVGYGVGASMASHLKEQLLQANEVLTGSRLLRGVAAVGGIRKRVDDSPLKRETLRRVSRMMGKSFEELVDVAMSSSSTLDRLETTGQLTRKDAYRLGVIGIAGRASGIDRDLRRDHPHCLYKELKFKASLHEEGDVLARFNVRIDEVRQSFAMLEELVDRLGDGPTIIAYTPIPSNSVALGYAEAWRGEVIHWVMTDATGRIARWKITDPSFRNWKAVTVAVRNNIVPDFPVINKSFNMSYSGNDR